MADAFAPQFGGEVRFNKPIETPTAPSTGEALMGLAGGFLKAFGNAQDARADENKAREPSFTERQAMAREKNLKDYTKKLSELKQQHESGDLSDAGFQIAISRLDTYSAGLGIDITSPEFDKVRTDITGLPSNMVGLTEDQIAINSLNASPEGQASIALAQAAILAQNPNQEPTTEQIVAHIKNIEAQKQEFDNLTVKTELDLKRELPKFQSQVVAMGEQFKGALSIIEANGIRIDDPEMLQNTYLDYQARKTEIVNKIPAGVADRDQIIKDLFNPIDQFFSGLGIDSEKFTRLPKDQLDLKRKAILAVEMLNQRPDAAAPILALGIMENDYKMTDDQYTLVQQILAGTPLVPSTPEWITDAGVVVTNDMITVATQLQSVGTEFLKDYQGTTDALKGVMGEEVWNNWTSRSDAENWQEFQSRAKIFGGFSVQAMRSGQVSTDTVFVNLGGMAASFGAIDTAEEAVSFAGIRSSVSAELPTIIDNLESVDPQKGKAARTMMWLSLGKAAKGFEAQITTAESANNLVFNPKTRTYNINTATLAPDDPERLWLAGVVQKRYGGDIVKAIGDDFALLQESDAIEGYSLGDSKTAARSLAPDVEEVKRTLDLRNSFVYLDGLSRQIEPEEARVAREVMNKPLSEVSQADVIGASSMEAIATTPRPGEITQTTLPEASGVMEGNGQIAQTLGIDFAGLEAQAGIPAGFLERTAYIESKGRVDAVSPTGATGLFQFTKGTAADYGLVDRNDPVQSTAAAVRLAVANQQTLRNNLGREPTGAELYLAHQQGAGGASAMLANPNANVVDALLPVYKGNRAKAEQAVEVNGGNVNMTAGEFANIWISKYNGARGPISASQATGRPTPVDPSNAIAVERERQAADVAVSMRPPAEAAPAAPATSMAPPAEAALPEQIEQPQPSQAAQEEAARTAPPVDREVAALIDEIAGNPDKTYASERELLAAQQRGELEPGDTIIVDGVAYMVRKDGTPKRLGVVQE